jgi:hypothetical protein
MSETEIGLMLEIMSTRVAPAGLEMINANKSVPPSPSLPPFEAQA